MITKGDRNCVDCGKTMIKVGKISEEEVFSRGNIYRYLFQCEKCKKTKTVEDSILN